MQKEYLSAAAEVLSDQGVDENLGLSDDEASSRLAKTGPNKLEEAEKTPLWKRFFEQMADPMVIMLIVAIARANGKHDDEYTFEENYDEVYSEDSYDDDDSAYDDEELGGRSPLFRPSENTAQSRSFEQKRSSIAENFERKQVNPNSPYQKARTMQFKAQHDVPIYTNPADQDPAGRRRTEPASPPETPAPMRAHTQAAFPTHLHLAHAAI